MAEDASELRWVGKDCDELLAVRSMWFPQTDEDFDPRAPGLLTTWRVWTSTASGPRQMSAGATPARQDAGCE